MKFNLLDILEALFQSWMFDRTLKFNGESPESYRRGSSSLFRELLLKFIGEVA